MIKFALGFLILFGIVGSETIPILYALLFAVIGFCLMLMGVSEIQEKEGL